MDKTKSAALMVGLITLAALPTAVGEPEEQEVIDEVLAAVNRETSYACQPAELNGAEVICARADVSISSSQVASGAGGTDYTGLFGVTLHKFSTHFPARTKQCAGGCYIDDQGPPSFNVEQTTAVACLGGDPVPAEIPVCATAVATARM